MVSSEEAGPHQWSPQVGQGRGPPKPGREKAVIQEKGKGTTSLLFLIGNRVLVGFGPAVPPLPALLLGAALDSAADF